MYAILAYFGSHKVIPTEYPAIYRHLKQFEDKLKKRGQCRYTSSGKPKPGAEYPGQHHWLELDNNPSISNLDDFSKHKLIWSDIATTPNFISVDEEIYFNNTCYMITNAPSWLYGYLNSDLVAWYLPRVIATDLGKKGARYFKQFVEQLSMPDMQGELYDLLHLSADEINFISSSVN